MPSTSLRRSSMRRGRGRVGGAWMAALRPRASMAMRSSSPMAAGGALAVESCSSLLLSHGGRRRSGHGVLLLTLLLWIPVIFQDDLAQIAASHLQENDLVYVSGQLTGHVPPFKHTDVQANIQVIANLLLFVDGKAVERNVMLDEEEGLMEIAEAEKKVAHTKPISKYPARTFTGVGLSTRR